MKTFLVGGAVRDAFLNYPVIEHDYVVVGSTPEQMLALGYTQVGKDFPVFLHPETKEEYALARKERKHGQGHTGFVCDFDPTVTLEEDLFRRDLTINAMAKSTDGQLIDPYNGQADIRDKLLRHVSPAFSEDPLRILRVARFAARYHYLAFRIAPETLTLMRQMILDGELKTLTKERIWLEVEKSLKTSTFHLILDVLNELGALNDALPMLPNWGQAHSQYVSDFLAQTKKSGAFNDPHFMHISQFCICLKECNFDELKKLEEDHKIPSDYAKSLRDYKLLLTLLAHDQLDANTVLNFFNQIDLWRRPARLNLLLEILKHTKNKCDIAKTLNNCAHSAKSINAQKIMALGYTGAAIKQGLQSARIEAIMSVLM